MSPAAVLEAEAETETPREIRPERVVWRVNSRAGDGLLGLGPRKVWTLERRLP